MISILAAIFVFGLLVMVHELGHFVTAKMTNMRVDEFAIGFGPKLWGYQSGETKYSIRAIPLGGFNRIAGMDMDEDEADAGERAYYNRPVWARMLVILAGSFMNFVLPLVIFFFIFMYSGIGTPSDEPVIGDVVAGHPAAEAGLMAGDRIVSINGNTVTEWKQLSELLSNGEGKVFKVVYEREGASHETRVIPQYEESQQKVVIGIISGVNVHQPTVAEAAAASAEKTAGIMKSMVNGLLSLVTGKADTAELSGPLGVAQMAGEVARVGIVPLFNFAAFLSLNLGIINLLPVPALDGGHFVTLCLEAVRGKPLQKETMYKVQLTGVVLLLSLMVFATVNDIMR